MQARCRFAGFGGTLRTAVRPGVWPCVRLLGVLACAGLLAGCSSRPETAWELIRQQKEEQAMVRAHEDRLARSQAPSQAGIMLDLIRQAQAQGRYFAALAYIEAHEQQFGRSAELDALRADALRMTGQPTQSEAAYRALLTTSQAAHGWHGLGLLAADRGDYAQAVADLTRAVKLAPTDPMMLSDLGYACLRAGDVAAARLPLGKAAELAPDNHKVLANLALLLLLDGEHDAARRVMHQAGLSEQARDRVQALAEELRHAAAPASAPAAASGPTSRGAQASVRPQPVMPVADQQPLLERFGSSMLLR